ncbi:hypothetical protein [Nocardioides sp. Kera G14]|uniref:hypothetical protein n=1 Tax=Nocardioides sp. Kera G14 TaxID=2884264 RepID=UPI001D10F531|nr:hypothetical protein [Nocardioides sp. Kera G14]UDY24670.1 hypothetical protein LH076_05025 [Nocardioides sp. Kera G14]
MIDYDGRVFRPVSLSPNGTVSTETVFVYRQRRRVITSAYQGGDIVAGHLIGLVDAEGNLDFRYHQLTVEGELQAGSCHSTPEVLEDGRIRLHESWQWSTGDRSTGTSTLEEVRPD